MIGDELASGRYVAVYEHRGWYYLEGLHNHAIIFMSKAEWHEFVSVIMEADRIISETD